ncbi:MAG: hypothetical protein HY401_09170, partial [Elusimicrobia bacterium]|nr:hypothetical protein [Elusimicrobiota bacterium]
LGPTVDIDQETVGSLPFSRLTGVSLPGGSTSYIQNTTTLQSGSTFYVASGTVAGALYISSTTSTAPVFQVNNSTFVILGNGNVGIGTTAPAYILEVIVNNATTNGITQMLRLDHETTGTAAAGIGAGLVFGAEVDDGTIKNIASVNGILTSAVAASYTSALTFMTKLSAGALTEQMRIDGAGNVGIGSTTPGAQLDVQATDNTNDLYSLRVGTGTAADAYHLSISTNSDIIFRNNLYIKQTSTSSISFFDRGGVEVLVIDDLGQ